MSVHYYGFSSFYRTFYLILDAQPFWRMDQYISENAGTLKSNWVSHPILKCYIHEVGVKRCSEGTFMPWNGTSIPVPCGESLFLAHTSIRKLLSCNKESFLDMPLFYSLTKKLMCRRQRTLSFEKGRAQQTPCLS